MKDFGFQIFNVWVRQLERHEDQRGDLTEVLNQNIWFPGITQINHSRTNMGGIVRGMHAQRGLAKMVYCIAGKAHDVVIDLRSPSPTYMKFVWMTLVPGSLLYVPPACAHGFQALVPNTELLYLYDHIYCPENEYGVRYDDPAFNIAWPLPVAHHLMSTRDLEFKPWTR